MDWNVILKQVIEALIPVAITILSSLLGWVGWEIKKLYKSKVDTELKHQIVSTVVHFIEQCYHDFSGADKFKKAVEETKLWLSLKGITITNEELKMLIEGAVRHMNQIEKGSEINGAKG